MLLFILGSALYWLAYLIQDVTNHRRDPYAKHRQPREVPSWILAQVLRKRKKDDL